MSLIFCDGFDDGLANVKWNKVYGAQASIVSSGRNNKGLRLGDIGTGVVKRQFISTDEHATITWGLAFRAGAVVNSFDGNSGHGNIGEIWSDNGATQHISVSAMGGSSNTSPRIDVWRGSTSSGTIIATAAVSPWVLSQWYYVEVSVVASSTVGTVTVKLNGTTIITGTSLNTLNGGTKTVYDSFGFGLSNTPNNGWYLEYDDVYITNGAGSANTGFLGDIAVETLLPNGNGSTSQFTNDAGNSTNNYTHVNEAIPDTTTYSQDSTIGDRDLYTMGDLVRTTGTIYGLIATSYAQASDSGARSLKSVIKSAAAIATSTAKAVVTTYQPVQATFETDPNTSAAWTVAGVNAAESGVEVA